MHTITEKIGIVNELVAYMQNPDNQTALTAKNFDVTPHIARLQGKLTSVTSLSSEQKQLDVQKQNKTAEVTDRHLRRLQRCQRHARRHDRFAGQGHHGSRQAPNHPQPRASSRRQQFARARSGGKTVSR